MGGAAGINLLLGMIRTKFAAVLIGTTGIGLLASFTAIQGIISVIAGLGIQSSAVREVAGAVGKGDHQAIGRTVLTLRRVCWFTGLVGMLAMMGFSQMLSQLTFGNNEYTLDIAALGIIILFGNLSGGQLALIQGTRRVGDMARANVYGAMFATLAAIGFYHWLGLRGIVPALVSVAAMQLALSWNFARRVPVPQVSLGWRQTFEEAGGMVRLGLVFMWTGLVGSAVSYFTVTLITQQIGLKAVGLYSAAFALSGMFVNFVLGAMGADYYPRLSGVAHDKDAVNRLVNEQTKVGLLLTVPGLIATMVLAPWIVRIFYTSEFTPAVELLQWFLFGCFGRVISWPIGYIFVAMKKIKLNFFISTGTEIIHVVFITFFINLYGLKGLGFAFDLLLIISTAILMKLARAVTGLRWCRELIISVLFNLALLMISMALCFVLSELLALVFGVLLSSLSAFFGLSQTGFIKNKLTILKRG